MDSGSASPDGGAMWTGSDAAARLMAIAERLVKDGRLWRGLDAFPGAADNEKGAIEKTGRLDGLPIGSWCDPRGFLAAAPWHRKRLRAEGSVEQWYDEINTWCELCAHHGRLGPSSPLNAGTVRGSYASRFLAVDITKHKGYPCYTGGSSLPDAAAAALVAFFLANGEIGPEDVLAAAKRFGCPLEDIAAALFNRHQPGRRWVRWSLYDDKVDGPVAAGEAMNWWPKVRDVWAFALLMAIAIRRLVGVAYEEMKMSMMHCVRSDEFGRIARLLHGMGLDADSTDFQNFDKSIGPNALRAAVMVMADRSSAKPGERAVLMATLTTPVLAPSHKPGHAAFLYKRDLGMMSGVPYTTLGDSIINGGLMIRVLRTLGMTNRQIRDTCGTHWFRLAMGDDTVTWFSSTLKRKGAFDRVIDENEKAGFKTTSLPGITFLSRVVNPRTGESIATAASLFRNALFKERKRRPLTAEIAALAMRSSADLLNRGDGLGTVQHPNAGVVMEAWREAVPDVYESATTKSLTQLTAEAAASARTEQQRTNLTTTMEDAYRKTFGDTIDEETGTTKASRIPISALEMRGRAIYNDWQTALGYLVERGMERGRNR